MGGFKKTGKARFTEHILYPENMIENWAVEIGDLLQVPYAYCLHDKDKSGHKGDRKPHLHLIQAWTKGSQTLKRAWENVEKLALPGRQCSIPPEAVAGIGHAYDYLIHDTESARKAGKHLYDVSERVTGNGFDIDRYETLDSEEKSAMCKEIMDFVEERKLKDFSSAYVAIREHFDYRYWDIYKANNAMVERLVRGNYLRFRAKAETLSSATCCICGEREVIGSFKDEETGGRLWFCAKHQETAYIVLTDLEEDRKEKSKKVNGEEQAQ